jgi:hypothetical protein
MPRKITPKETLEREAYFNSIDSNINIEEFKKWDAQSHDEYQTMTSQMNDKVIKIILCFIVLLAIAALIGYLETVV